MSAGQANGDNRSYTQRPFTPTSHPPVRGYIQILINRRIAGNRWQSPEEVQCLKLEPNISRSRPERSRKLLALLVAGGSRSTLCRAHGEMLSGGQRCFDSASLRQRLPITEDLAIFRKGPVRGQSHEIQQGASCMAGFRSKPRTYPNARRATGDTQAITAPRSEVVGRPRPPLKSSVGPDRNRTGIAALAAGAFVMFDFAMGMKHTTAIGSRHLSRWRRHSAERA